ncbi:hypothetical protein Tco_0588241 [Tanacetum coccineum]
MTLTMSELDVAGRFTTSCTGKEITAKFANIASGKEVNRHDGARIALVLSFWMAHLKIYKEQFDSIKRTRVRTKEYSESYILQLISKSVANADLKAQIQGKVFVITSLKNDLRKLKGKEIVKNSTQIPMATTIAPGMFKLDLDPLAPRLLNNKDAHIDYLKYNQEKPDILRGIVEQAKAKRPLDNALDFSCKHAKRIQELLVYVRDTCPNMIKLSEKKVAVIPMNKVKKLGLKSSSDDCRSKPTVRMTKVIKGEFEKIKDVKVEDVSLTCYAPLEVFNNEVSRLSGMNDDLFTYEVKVANIPCDLKMDYDSENEADDDMGYDSSDVAFTEWLGSKNFNYKTMDHYTMKALWIYWISGDDEVELTDEESSDDMDNVAEVFRIDTNLFNFETPIIFGIYEWNKDIPWVDEKPWTNAGVWTKPTPDYEWYKALKDSELKDLALRNKDIMEGFIKDDDDESRDVPKVKIDNPNITMEEYIRHEEEKARRRGKVYNWETATYGQIGDNKDVHDLRSIETEFPAIVFNDTLTSEATLSCEPTVSSLNDNKIDFIKSFDESDDEDYMIIFDKNSFSCKIISTNDLKTDSENDNEKVNMPSLPPPEPMVSYFDNLDYLKILRISF